ncbi:XK-related protein 7 isoform X1 [Procambarus clarkii]|uniref:XK-related protein 7 isoform X1 n=1 Tax=Procambarus clarkii TaxID=6728 RepID=UPI003741ECDA
MKTRPSMRVAFAPLPLEEEDTEAAAALNQDADHHNWSPSTTTKPCSFTYWSELVIWCSIIFYVADLCLDLWVCAAHFEALRPQSAWFIFFCILLPNLYAGYKSLQWYLRAHELFPIRRPSVWIVRILFFPISPILRYLDAWRYGRRARQHWRNHNLPQERKSFEKYLVENAEVALLRLVIIFLEDAPIVVLNLAQLLQTPPVQWTKISEGKADPEIVRLGSVLAKLLCTMTLGVVHYMSCNKLAWHLANTHNKKSQDSDVHSTKDEWESKGRLSWAAELAIYCWQLLAITSRVVAYALFWVVHFSLLWVPILIRWTIHTLWIYFDVAEMSLINSVAFGGVYLFSFVTTSPGRQILRITLYYVITFGEHIIIAIFWHYGAPDNYFHNYGIGVMFGGTAGGVLFLTLYYSCCHPDQDSIWARQKWAEAQKRLREFTERREQRSPNQTETP